MPNSENSLRVIRKAALAFFKNKEMLLVRDNKNEEAFYNPGGKIEEGETDLECLKREIKEELDVDLDMSSVKFLGEFEAPAHRKPDTRVNIRLFTGDLNGEPKPHDEIVELRFFDSSIDQKHTTPILETKIFPWLKQHGYIN
jgi:8-oxo-dGTP diphosphatase